MKILLTGSSGLVGSELVPFLRAAGESVTRLVRRPAHEGGKEIAWNPAEGKLDPAALEGFDAAVHLAGENLAARRWSPAFKMRLRDSRVESTRLLASALAGLHHPPKVFLVASAIGFYGSQRAEPVDESSQAGSGFLADMCRAWEEASQIGAKGVRVVNLRTGFVLSTAGGGLAKMLTPFRLGLGGRVGSGNQVISWIAINDLIEALYHALTRDELRGPVNATSPNPATNAEFTRALGRALGRPTIFPMPAFAMRLLFGEMVDETMLASQRVAPAKLLASGFTFRFPELDSALRHVLNKE